jgi:hypothetical protein
MINIRDNLMSCQIYYFVIIIITMKIIALMIRDNKRMIFDRVTVII